MMKDYEYLCFAIPTTMTDNSTDTLTEAFEKERAVLLERWIRTVLGCPSFILSFTKFPFASLSVQLTQVLEQITQANAQMEQLNDQAQVVHEIARLWKDAASMEEETSNSNIHERANNEKHETQR